MRSLKESIDGCPPPAASPKELVEQYAYQARYGGADQIKNDAASAKRTATQLEKAVRQFTQLTTKDKTALLDAALAMRTLARNLTGLTRWADNLKAYCSKVRKADLVAEMTQLAATRWANPQEQEFELALVDELNTKEGLAAYAAWHHGNRRHRQIQPKEFSFNYNRNAAANQDAGDFPLHLRHLIALTEDYGFSDGGPRASGWFYIGRAQFEEYLNHRKSLAMQVQGFLSVFELRSGS